MKKTACKSSLRNRQLRIESLESRELLSINVLPVPGYSSLPEATNVIFIDFNGNDSGISFGESANVGQAFDFDGDADSFSDLELKAIHDIWAVVAENFRPFNINVTTVDPGSNGSLRGVSAYFNNGVGMGNGLGWVGNFNGSISRGASSWSGTTIYANGVPGNWNQMVTAISQCLTHEVGHNLGLGHDGTIAGGDGSYYFGHTTAAGVTHNYWNAFMGGDMIRANQVQQWNDGSYENANNQQDDLAIITTRNGSVTYRDDEVMPELTFLDDKALANGIIERSYDVDEYSFDVPQNSGVITIEAFSGIKIDTNSYSSLYYSLDLYKGTRRIAHEVASLNDFSASISQELEAGIYTVRISGIGYTPEGSYQGFSGYGSLGSYTLTIDGIRDLPPVVPANLRSTIQTENSILLNWDFQKRLGLQVLQYKKSSEGESEWKDWTGTLKATDTSANFTGLETNTSYDFRLNATNNSGTSDWASITVKTKTPFWTAPSQPNGFQSVAQTLDTVSLSWKSQINITRYELQYKKSTDTEWTLVTVSPIKTSEIISGLQAGTSYQFQLRAVNKDAASEWYGINVTTNNSGNNSDNNPDKPVLTPATPTNFKTEQDGTNVKLTWSAAANAKTYRICRWDNATGKWLDVTTTVTGTTYTFDPAGSTKFLLRAYNGASYGGSTTATLAVTVGVPANFKAVSSGSNVVLTWSAAENAKTYRICRWDNATGKWLDVITTVTGTTITFDPAGSTKFLLRAYNGTFYGGSATATLPPAVVVGVPANFKAVQSGSNAVLTWSAAANAKTYRICRWDNATGKWVDVTTTVTGTTFTFDPAGSTRFLLRAYNGTSYGGSATATLLSGGHARQAK